MRRRAPRRAAERNAPFPHAHTVAFTRASRLLAGGRYEVKRFLGEGGRKRVYLIHLVRLHAETGRAAEARGEFEGFAVSSFADLPRDGRWLSMVAGLSEVCCLLADAGRAAILYGLLLPYADRNVVYQGFGGYSGSAAQFSQPRHEDRPTPLAPSRGEKPDGKFGIV